MAVLMSCATGDFTAAATWALVDATSLNNTENSSTVVTTTYATSSTFTPGAITIDGIAVKLVNRTGTTGTITVALDQATTTVTGTEVAINVADLPAAVTADANGGWVLFKFAAPVLLVAATAYGVKVKTSSSTQVTLQVLTAGNWARMLRTTTTQAPAAGDDLVITGEYTGAGTSNAFTVTMDNTASTDFGAASTSLTTPALAICSLGTLTWGTTAATAYYLKLSGNAIVYAGGTLNMGTTGTPCPRDSSMWMQFDCGANVDFGLTVRNLATWNGQGQSRTSGKLFDRTLLNTDEAVNQTVLGVADDTGWLDNDEIVIAPTNRTIAEYEKVALNGAAGASSITIDGGAGAGGGLAFTHSGTSPTQATIILLTRNVRITGTSATLQAYVGIKATATVDLDWCQFYWLGSATTNTRGFQTACTTGTQSFNRCSFHNFEASGSTCFMMTGASGTGLTFSNNVMYFGHTYGVDVAASTGSCSITGCVVIRAGTYGFSMSDAGGTFTNNLVASGGNSGVFLSENGGTIGTWSDITVQQSGNSFFVNGVSGPMSNVTIWRNTAYGLYMAGNTDVTVTNLVSFGNNIASVNFAGGGSRLTLITPTLSGDSSFATTYGLAPQTGQASSGNDVHIFGGSLGTASGIKVAHSTGDIGFAAAQSGASKFHLHGTTLASATQVAAQTSNGPNGYILAQNLGAVAGAHKGWFKYGTIDIASPTVSGMTDPVMRMTPNNASSKLESAPYGMGMKAAVASGGTVTISVDIHKTAAYNGNQPRLLVRRNYGIGITSDTVLDTATVGTATTETLTGTTASVSDDGALEFIVDCDGTAGYCYVDNWAAS